MAGQSSRSYSFKKNHSRRLKVIVNRIDIPLPLRKQLLTGYIIMPVWMGKIFRPDILVAKAFKAITCLAKKLPSTNGFYSIAIISKYELFFPSWFPYKFSLP